MTDPLPRAWLQEPKVQRHAGMHLIRGVRTVEPTAEEYEFAELDGDAFIPLYDRAALDAAVAAERERCAAFLERGIDLSGLNSHPGWQRYTVDLLIACAAVIRNLNDPANPPKP